MSTLLSSIMAATRIRHQGNGKMVFYGTRSGKQEEDTDQLIPFVSRGNEWIVVVSIVILMSFGVYFSYEYAEARRRGGGVRDIFTSRPQEDGTFVNSDGSLTNSAYILGSLVFFLVLLVGYLMMHHNMVQPFFDMFRNKDMLSLSDEGTRNSSSVAERTKPVELVEGADLGANLSDNAHWVQKHFEGFQSLGKLPYIVGDVLTKYVKFKKIDNNKFRTTVKTKDGNTLPITLAYALKFTDTGEKEEKNPKYNKVIPVFELGFVTDFLQSGKNTFWVTLNDAEKKTIGEIDKIPLELTEEQGKDILQEATKK